MGAFLKIGFFTFGGGYAMLALIEDACVERHGWITHEEMMDVTVVAESTPGPIAIIFLLSNFPDRFLELPIIAHAFESILILDAAINKEEKSRFFWGTGLVSLCIFWAG